MRQRRMLFRLSIKRAVMKLPQLILGSVIISAVVIMVVLLSAYSRNKEEVLGKTRLAIVAGNNEFFKEVGGKIIGGMESGGSMLEIDTEKEEEALEKFEKGELEGVIVFPDDYLGNLGRGEDTPARIYIRSEGVAFDLGIIVNLAAAAESDLTTAESANYALVDTLLDFSLDDLGREYDNGIDLVNLRMVLSREDNFMKMTLVGDGDISLTQSYACAALVMLLLLWGLSCGAMVRSEGRVMTTKLSVSGVTVFTQEIIRLFSIVFLLGTMLLLVFLGLLAAFRLTPASFEQVGIYDQRVIYLLFVSLLPSLILSGAVVQFCFTAASNEIGGILLLFTGTISMGYASGCLLPSVYLPKTLRSFARILPTTYMHEGAENALIQKFEPQNIIIQLLFAAGFFIAAMFIRSYKSRRN